MKHFRHSNKGFTLLEVMVVIFIIATISGLSTLGLKQASDRRYFSQAENLLAWLQQISELAMLEGTAYGFVYQEQSLYPMVFYRQRWHQVAKPEAFLLYDDGVIDFPGSSSFSLRAEEQDDKKVLLPDVVMQTNGYMEPALSINLAYTKQAPKFSYYWDDEAFSLVMESTGGVSQ